MKKPISVFDHKSIRYKNNVVGIIPVNENHLGLNYPWPDYMMPIDKDYTLVENAVVTQSVLGVDSIWIVASPSTTGLLKARVGENILDPTSLDRLQDEFLRSTLLDKRSECMRETNWWTSEIKIIPIYYISLPNSDRLAGLEGSDLWKVMYGAYTLNNVLRKFTSFMEPKKYVVTNPYGITPMLKYFTDRNNHEVLKQLRMRMANGRHRGYIGKGEGRSRSDRSDKDQMLLFVDESDKSAVDGNRLTFSFDKKIWEEMRKYVYKESKTCYNINDDGSTSLMTFKDFLPTVSKHYKRAHRYTMSPYHEINSYEDYSRYMGFRASLMENDDKCDKMDFKPNYYMEDYRLGRSGWGERDNDVDVILFKNLFTGDFV